MQRFRTIETALAIMLVASTTACGGDSRDAAKVASAAAPRTPDAVAEPNTAGTDGAQDRPRRTLTESDQLRLEMASRACRAKDFGGFFQAFTGSWAVRAEYTAAEVRFGELGRSRSLTRQQYLDRSHYPLAMTDYLYVTLESAMLFESNAANPEVLRYVLVEINQSSDNRARVDWLPGIFERDLAPPRNEVGEDLGELVQKTGSGGQFLFQPTTTCWELVEDIANPPLEI